MERNARRPAQGPREGAASEGGSLFRPATRRNAAPRVLSRHGTLLGFIEISLKNTRGRVPATTWIVDCNLVSAYLERFEISAWRGAIVSDFQGFDHANQDRFQQLSLSRLGR